MPQQKMTYAERVQKTKHQIVNTYNENQYTWGAIHVADVREVAIQQVAAQAEAIREFARICFVAMPDKVDIWLQERGYTDPATDKRRGN